MGVVGRMDTVNFLIQFLTVRWLCKLFDKALVEAFGSWGFGNVLANAVAKLLYTIHIIYILLVFIPFKNCIHPTNPSC